MRAGEFFDTPHFDLSGGYEPGAPGIHEKAHRTADRLVAEYVSRVPDKVIEAVKRHFGDRYQDRSVAGQ